MAVPVRVLEQAPLQEWVLEVPQRESSLPPLLAHRRHHHRLRRHLENDA